MYKAPNTREAKLPMVIHAEPRNIRDAAFSSSMKSASSSGTVSISSAIAGVDSSGTLSAVYAGSGRVTVFVTGGFTGTTSSATVAGSAVIISDGVTALAVTG